MKARRVTPPRDGREAADGERIVIPEHRMRQGSGRWRKWRRERLTATQANVILRLFAPWDDAPKSWEEARAPRPWVRPNDAMTHGTRCEPLARRSFSRDMDEDFQPACIEATVGGYAVGASLDGYSGENPEAWVEIKSPYRGYESRLWSYAAEDDMVDPHYLPQLAMQAMLMPEDADCFFHVYVSPWFDPYTGERERKEGSVTLQVSRAILEPYIEQLSTLIPLYAAGDPEPSEDEIPLVVER